MAEKVYICRVMRAGAGSDGTVLVSLQDTEGAFWHYFTAATGGRREILTTALTAIASGLKVAAYLDDTSEYAQLNQLYVAIT